MKTVEEQINDLITAIEKQEGNIQVLQAKLAKLVRQSRKQEPTNESTTSGSQLLQE